MDVLENALTVAWALRIHIGILAIAAFVGIRHSERRS